MSDQDDRKITTRDNHEVVESQPEKTIKLTDTTNLDLTGMGDDAVSELRKRHAEGTIDTVNKGRDLQVEGASLRATLDTLNHEAGKAANQDTKFTATHAQTSSLGRTEVVIGNTDRASSGKLSSSATGAFDSKIIVAAIIAAAIVLFALIRS